MNQTPHKDRDIDCFVCFSSNITAFKLSGRKLINEDFKEKLTSLLNENTYNELILKDASLCRNCYNLVNKTSVFLEKLSHSCDSFLKAPTSSKRCALSPITPKSVDTNPIAAVKNRTVKRSSRKQLKLFESPNETVTKPTCFPVNENSDPASFPVIIPVNEIPILQSLKILIILILNQNLM
ncbi:unnamed protein product [Mytilus edulis]|uniref:ZAD domain-containing protein n=1 Tax=Mytilus edulis TaxID=6550 RepID=A0A8S3PWZ8_MYTED|nr:unnamed protein product [Mytilus edulis]